MDGSTSRQERGRGLGGIRSPFLESGFALCRIASLKSIKQEVHLQLFLPWGKFGWGARRRQRWEAGKDSGKAEALGERFHLASKELSRRRFRDLIAGAVPLLSAVS